MDRNKHKRHIKYVVYNMTHGLFANFPSLHIRRVYFRMFMEHLGKDCYIAKGVDVRQPMGVSIGDRVIINKRVVLDGRGGLEIKNDVDIAQDTFIWSQDHDMNHPDHKSHIAKVVVEDHVWIASRATILPGVHLKRGSVVASGAVVTKDVEELTVVGGVPAKLIKKRENPLTYLLHHKPKIWDYQ